MLKLKIILLIFITMFIACNNKNNSEDISKQKSEKTHKPPIIIRINTDSLPKKIIDKRKLIKNKGAFEIESYYNSAVIPGISNLHQTKEDRLSGVKPIKSSFPKTIKKVESKSFKIVKKDFEIQNGDTIYAPKTYIFNNKKFLVQHGDTIYPPKIKTVIQPQRKKTLPPSYKDNSTYNVKYLNIDQGLPSAYIRTMLEDKKGNIWISTRRTGLSKYDGKNFWHYTKENGLLHNEILTIIEDSKGNLWFGTRDGLSKFNGNEFTHFTIKNGLSNNIIRVVFEDSKNNIWIGTRNGLNKLELNSIDGVENYKITHFTKENGLSYNEIWAIYEDSKGNMWFGTYGGGVTKFDGDKFTHFTKKTGLSDNYIVSITEDFRGSIWFVSLQLGATRYDGKEFTHFTTKNGLSNNEITQIYKDSKNNLWFASQGGGITKYDNEKFTYYTKDMGFVNDYTQSIMEDKEGNFWFGTWGGGLSIYKENFVHFNDNNGLRSNSIWSMCKDSKGNIWLGHDKGLSKFDGNSFTHISKNFDLNGIYVMAITEDSKGNIWFGTYGNGLYKFDGISVTNYTIKDGLSSDDIRAIREDSKGSIWIGTNGGGINIFDGKKFTHLTQKNGLASNSVWAIIEDKKGNLWFGTWNGLNKLSITKDSNNEFYELTQFTTENGLSSNIILSLYMDNEDDLWIGTLSHGLNKYNGKKFIYFNKNDGLSNNNIWSIIGDDKNNIWLGTSNGLNLLATKNDSLSKKGKTNKNKYSIIDYCKQDGLKTSDFLNNSVIIDNKNTAWWGTGNALSSLNLNNFNIPSKAPEIQLTEILINEKFIDFNNINDSSNIKLKEGLKGMKFSETDAFYNYPLQLELPYNLNHLTFCFSSIDWNAPHKIKYSFMLEGFDENWSSPTAENKADYRNILYGNYQFKVKAIGEAKVWSRTFEYRFIVYPPWWNTWWARAIYVLAFIIVLYLVLRWRTAKLKQRQKELEKIVKQRTLEVVTKSREISDANDELNQQADKLLILNENLNQYNEEIKTQRDEIEKQKEVVVFAHKNITDSINYAKTIQDSLLPSSKIINELFKESFIFFKPKDVVSGDFYYLSKEKNEINFAVADSTGHGVPGGFLTMLGITFINDIVETKKTNNVKDVLELLREQIKSIFKTFGSENVNGFDIAFCKINTQTNILQYAGAYNPLWIIRDNELLEYKATRTPIGFCYNPKEFTSTNIKLKNNDLIYLFSDGYQDQIGGKEERKILIKGFRKIILDNHKLPLSTQKENLEKIITEWQANLEQVDDITVMGIKWNMDD